MNISQLPKQPFSLEPTHQVCREGVSGSMVLDALDSCLLRGDLEIEVNQRRLGLSTTFEEAKCKYSCSVEILQPTPPPEDTDLLVFPSNYRDSSPPRFVVYVYEKSGLFIVEFQLRQGCQKTFQDIYQHCWSEIVDMDTIN